MEAAKTTVNTPVAGPAAAYAVKSKMESGENQSLFYPGSPYNIIQPKLSIGAPDDIYEKEADAMADKVMRMPMPSQVNFLSTNNTFQRKCAHCEEEEKQLQKKGTGTDSNVTAPPIVHDVLNSSAGKSLDAGTRAFMEPRFNYDFSSVKVHDNDLAAKSANSINALAYTSGNNVVFNSGQYNTSSDSGKRLLAHELTHVVQQEGMKSAIQKQDGEGTASTGPVADTSTTVPDFGHTPNETTCPTNPSRLGDVLPEPPCDESVNEIDGEKFFFCKGSDVFQNPADANRLVSFVRSQQANSFFEVHAYASQENSSTYNLNLACHRAKRTARSMINAGVRSERITLVNKGATTRFGEGHSEKQLKQNRVVLIAASSVPTQPVGELPANSREIVNLAKNKLINGEYRLAADAYISMWTCGTIRSISEAVKRVSVIIEGDPGALRVVEPMGHPSHLGINSIVLSAATFNTDNILECVMARIIDMAFHHMARPEIPDPGQVHSAAVFLVELAGLAPCRTKSIGELPDMPGSGIPGENFWPRVTIDPMAAQDPSCAATQLEGPKVSGDRKEINRNVPVFNAVINPSSSSGNILFDNDDGIVSMDSPRGAISISANVTMTGDPTEFSNYQIGFIQTIIENDTTMDYTAGNRVNSILPLPIRDGMPSSSGGKEPWFDPRFVETGDSSGNVIAHLSDSPAQKMPYTYLDFERSTLETMILSEKRQVVTNGIAQDIQENITHRAHPEFQPGNELNRASRHIVFNTWLVARRIGSSLDKFATHFLRGSQVIFDMDLDMIGPRGTGNFSVTSSNTSDTSPMQFRDPVAADIRPALQFTITGAAPRKAIPDRQQERLEILRFFAEINRIAEPIRLRMGLTDSLLVKIHINAQTGRISISLPGSRAVETTSSGRVIPQDILDNFSEELFFNIRKDITLDGSLGTVNVPLHPLTSTGAGNLSFTRLIDRPGVRIAMRDMWIRSVADRLNLQELSLTIVINRETGIMTPIRRAGVPESEGGGNSVPICIPIDMNLLLTHSVLGTIHTHPDPDGMQEPSDEDLKAIQDNPERCGAEHYVITDDFIYQFTGNSRSRLGGRQALLGN